MQESQPRCLPPSSASFMFFFLFFAFFCSLFFSWVLLRVGFSFLEREETKLLFFENYTWLRVGRREAKVADNGESK